MRHTAHVIHHIPGRVRIKLPHAKGNRALLQQIMRSISPMNGVKQVEINTTTGSITVHYDPEVHEDFHASLADHGEATELFGLKPPGLSEADEIAEKIEAEAEFLSAHSDIARAIVNGVKHLNEAVKLASNNAVDLKVLLPLGLAFYTFVEAGTETVTPLWVTLGIFSFNSFVALHRPHTKVNVDTHEVILDDPKQAQSVQRDSASPVYRKSAGRR